MRSTLTSGPKFRDHLSGNAEDLSLNVEHENDQVQDNTQVEGMCVDSDNPPVSDATEGIVHGAKSQEHQLHSAAPIQQLATTKNFLNPVRNIDLSHDALALKLGVTLFNENARYVPGSNRWYFWAQTHWMQDSTKRHVSRIRDFLRAEAKALTLQAAYEATGMKAGAANALLDWAKEQAKILKGRSTVSAVETLVQANWGIAINQEDFDTNPLLLGTCDGTIDLKSGSLIPAQRDHLITKLTACGPAELGSSPALWLKFLHRVFDGDQEVIDFMQRAAGYALTGLTNEHKLLFLHGGGRNGKSVFLDTLRWLLGDYARTANSSLLLTSGQNQHATGLAGLQGARLVIASEIPKNATWNEAIIKDLTGGEKMSARYMRGDFFDFKPQMTLMIAGNDKPRLNGVDKAMRARFILVPFDVFIPEEERDPNLAEKLREEGPAILRWAIEGALQWQVRGLDVPETIKKASLAYMDEEDVLKAFLDEETISSPGDRVKSQELYDRYREWCQRQGMQAEKRASFTQDLKARGYQETKRSIGRVFLDLNLV